MLRRYLCVRVKESDEISFVLLSEVKISFVRYLVLKESYRFL